MSSQRVRILLIMLVAVLALTAGETLLAKGMRQAGRAQRGWTGEVAAALRSGWVWAGLALLVVHVGLYMTALSAADLSFVLPLTAASYPLAALLSKFYLHEEVNLTRWVGTLIITVGVAVVTVGEAADR